MGMYCDKHRFYCSTMDSIVGMSTEDSILRSRTRGSKTAVTGNFGRVYGQEFHHKETGLESKGNQERGYVMVHTSRSKSYYSKAPGKSDGPSNPKSQGPRHSDRHSMNLGVVSETDLNYV